MSNMNPDITLVNVGDRPNLQVLRQLLIQTQDVGHLRSCESSVSHSKPYIFEPRAYQIGCLFEFILSRDTSNSDW